MQKQQNQREIYKVKKLKEVQKIFFCQCGKNYLTFAALYLHARIKHEIKFTTKRTESVCKQQMVGKQIHITYFLKQYQKQLEQEIIQSQRNQKTISHIKTEADTIKTIQQWLNEFQNSNVLHTAFQFIAINYFKKYIVLIAQLSINKQEINVFNLPLFFNQFLTIYLTLKSQKFKFGQFQLFKNVAQQSLVELWKWLKSKGLTSHVLIHNS